MSTISASAARQTLPAQLDRVEAGEEVSITRHGKVVAVLISPEKLRSRRADMVWVRADDIGVQLERARTQPLSPGIEERRAEVLVAALRADRAAR